MVHRDCSCFSSRYLAVRNFNHNRGTGLCGYANGWLSGGNRISWMLGRHMVPDWLAQSGAPDQSKISLERQPAETYSDMDQKDILEVW